VVKRDALIRAILRKAGRRRRGGDATRPYMTKKELHAVNGFLDVQQELIDGKGNHTRSS
jgi:hypothetical protein